MAVKTLRWQGNLNTCLCLTDAFGEASLQSGERACLSVTQNNTISKILECNIASWLGDFPKSCIMPGHVGSERVLQVIRKSALNLHREMQCLFLRQ